MSKKKSSRWISTKSLKKTERHNLAVCGSLCGEKQFLLIFISYHWCNLKKLLKKSKFSTEFALSKMVRKTTFWVFQWSFLRWSLSCLKRIILYEFPPKCLKTTEKQCLAVCGSICGEKKFWLIFVNFYWFDQKHLLKQIQISLKICHFQTWLKKKSDYFSARFWDVISMSNKKIFLWISPKLLQNNRNA